MKSDTFANIEHLIENWAIWARSNLDMARGYPKQSPIARLVPTPDRRPGLAIDDETALAVDAAIAALMRRDKEIGEALVIYAATGCNIKRSADLLELSRYNFVVRKSAALAWLDGTLSAVSALAD